jgi:putative component of toxin-antitoxin plasmid stabilization module
MLNAGDKSTRKRDIRHALKLASEPVVLRQSLDA